MHGTWSEGRVVSCAPTNAYAYVLVRRRRIAKRFVGFIVATLMLGGCFTNLGYVPYDVYAPRFGSTCKNGDDYPPCRPPNYSEVRNWVARVADGYESRATLNRQANYGGALLAAGATASLAGLAAFNTGNNAIVALPIGTTFVAGSMAVYNNEKKAVIYGSASDTILRILNQSDCRVKRGVNMDTEAVCLHGEVSALMDKVNEHVTALDPQNVVDSLKAVASSAQAKKQKANSLQQQADQARSEAQQKASASVKAQEAVSKARGNAKTVAETNASDAQKTASAAQDEAANKQHDADQASNDANQETGKIVSLSQAGNDFSDLTEVPKIGGICATLPSDCELAETGSAPSPTPTPTPAPE